MCEVETIVIFNFKHLWLKMLKLVLRLGYANDEYPHLWPFLLFIFTFVFQLFRSSSQRLSSACVLYHWHDTIDIHLIGFEWNARACAVVKPLKLASTLRYKAVYSFLRKKLCANYCLSKYLFSVRFKFLPQWHWILAVTFSNLVMLLIYFAMNTLTIRDYEIRN